MTDTVWAAIDKLTKATTVPVERAADPEWLNEIGEGRYGACSVAAYRAATAHVATIPSLWDQAEAALGTGSEQTEGTGTSPLRERSPVDVELMEILGIIRDTTAHELHQRHAPAADTVPEQLRRLASVVTADPDCDGEWWAYRFSQWARLLENKLQAAEHTAKPIRLRNAPCPLCKTRQVRVEVDGDIQLVPPIIIDFRDGIIRAARCDACGESWFRGAELHVLADLIAAPELSSEAGRMSA